MKLALDSNLAVSSILFPKSVSGAVLSAWRAGTFEWACCDSQFHELSAALLQPRILSRIAHGAEPVMAMMLEIRANCRWARLPMPVPAVCRDPRDDFLFALHDKGHVDWIISGDKDVVALKNRYPVLTPRELIDRL